MDPISGYQLGSIALKALSKTVEHLNGEQDDELTARVRLIYEAAATDFFAEVGNEFGRPGSTFVDREDNVVAVVRSMFYHGDPLAAEALSFEGFDQSPRATHAAVGRFVELVMVHM